MGLGQIAILGHRRYLVAYEVMVVRAVRVFAVVEMAEIEGVVVVGNDAAEVMDASAALAYGWVVMYASAALAYGWVVMDASAVVVGDITGISVNRDVLGNDTITIGTLIMTIYRGYGSLELNCQSFHKQLDSFASELIKCMRGCKTTGFTCIPSIITPTLSNVEGRGEGGVTGSRWWGERLTLVLLFMSRHVFVGK